MRLFIAIKLPLEVEEELRRVQNELDQEGLKLPKDFHLTLKFLGEIDEEKAGILKTKLSNITFGSFRLALDGLDVFTPKRVRVVHISVQPPEQITELFEKVHNATNEIEIDHEFTPHITLARVKFLEDRKAFLDKVNKINVKPLGFDVGAFYLIKSTLTGTGPIYDDQAEFPAKPL